MLEVLSEMGDLYSVMCVALALLVLYVGQITIGKFFVVHSEISDRGIQFVMVIKPGKASPKLNTFSDEDFSEISDRDIQQFVEKLTNG